MNNASRHGHVSRQRLLGEGSAFVRQLAQAQQADAEQGPRQRADGHDGTTDEPQEPAVITFNELWDARTTAHHVSASAAEFTDRLLGVQLWWPHAPEPASSKAVQAAGGKRYKAARVQFLQHSSSLAQLMQYQGQAGRGKSREPESDRHLAACRGLAAGLLGPPAGDFSSLQHSTSRAVRKPTSGSSDWWCCNKSYPGQVPAPSRSLEAVASAAVCGHVNPADADSCYECGAAGLVGADGQLTQQLLAVLQTADLGATGMRQVGSRIAAESGSHPAVGVQLRSVAFKAGVGAFLAQRRAAAAGSRALEVVPLQGGAPAAADSVSLHVPGSHPSADGVFQSLVSWHLQQHSKEQLHSQQQQQQQQQQLQHQQHQQLAQVHQIHLAASAAAALLPQLLTAAYRDCNGLQQQGVLKPCLQHQVPPLLHIWVADVLEQAAAAAHNRPSDNLGSKSQRRVFAEQVGSSGSSKRPAVVQPLPVRCPLSAATLQQLLDRRTAVLRQQVIDYAQQLARQGKLPVVKRTFCFTSDDSDSIDKHVYYSEHMPVWEWLWTQTYLTATTDYLCKNIVKHAKLPGEGSAEAVDIIHCITCDDWPGVMSIRRQMQLIITTWLRMSAPHLAATPSTLQRAQLMMQLQRRLIMQQQLLPQAWGTAPPLALREALSALSAQHHLQQQGHHSTSTPGVPPHSIQHAKQQQTTLKGRDVPSAAATAKLVPDNQPANETMVNNTRKRGREQSQDDADDKDAQHTGQLEQQSQRPSAGKNKIKAAPPAAAAAADADGRTAVRPTAVVGRKRRRQEAAVAAGSSPAAHETGSGSGTAFLNDAASAERSRGKYNHLHAGYDGQSGDHVQQATAHTGRGGFMSTPSGAVLQRVAAGMLSLDPSPDHADCDGIMAGFELYLASVDDLLMSSPAEACQAFPVRPGGAWRPVGTRRQGISSRICNGSGTGADVAGICSRPVVEELPAGMQAVLRQAAAAGISSAVLRRTAARVRQLYCRSW